MQCSCITRCSATENILAKNCSRNTLSQSLTIGIVPYNLAISLMNACTTVAVANSIRILRCNEMHLFWKTVCCHHYSTFSIWVGWSMSEVHGNLRPCHLFASIMVVEVQEEKASQLYLTHITWNYIFLNSFLYSLPRKNSGVSYKCKTLGSLAFGLACHTIFFFLMILDVLAITCLPLLH